MNKHISTHANLNILVEIQDLHKYLYPITVCLSLSVMVMDDDMEEKKRHTSIFYAIRTIGYVAIACFAVWLIIRFMRVMAHPNRLAKSIFALSVTFTIVLIVLIILLLLLAMAACYNLIQSLRRTAV